MEKISFDDLYVGQKVTDCEGNQGEVVEIIDNHNVNVRLKTIEGFTGRGLYCLVDGCEHYDPLYEYKDGSCPCLYLKTPCNERCTCLNPFSSRGCDFCATYGSLEQRKAKAELLAGILRGEIKIRKEIDKLIEEKGNKL